MDAANTDSIQIYLNSKYASTKPNGDTGDCVFQIPTLELPDGYYVYISLQQAVIPYSFYSINSRNNYFHIEDASGNSYSFTVEQGNYNITQMISALLAEMGGGWAIVYKPITNKIQITNTLGVEFTVKADGTLNHALGFMEDADATSVSATLSSIHGINLNQIRAINVELANMPCSTINTAQPLNQNIISTLPVTSAPYGMIFYENQNGFRVNMYCSHMNRIHIRLLDNLGQLMQMNNVNWQMTLQIDIVSFRD
jgi:hypothetical protein